MKREPLFTVATITAAVTAVLALLAAFGLDLTGDQRTAILGVVAVLAPLVVATIARGQVTPAGDVVAQVPSSGVGIVAGPASNETDGTPVKVEAIEPLDGPRHRDERGASDFVLLGVVVLFALVILIATGVLR